MSRLADVLNSPNLKRPATRQPDIHGYETLAGALRTCPAPIGKSSLGPRFHQSIAGFGKRGCSQPSWRTALLIDGAT